MIPWYQWYQSGTIGTFGSIRVRPPQKLSSFFLGRTVDTPPKSQYTCTIILWYTCTYWYTCVPWYSSTIWYYVLVHMCTMVPTRVLRGGTHVYHGTTCVLPLCTRHVYCNARVRTRVRTMVPWYWNGPTFHKLAPLASWQVSGPCLHGQGQRSQTP